MALTDEPDATVITSGCLAAALWFVALVLIVGSIGRCI